MLTDLTVLWFGLLNQLRRQSAGKRKKVGGCRDTSSTFSSPPLPESFFCLSFFFPLNTFHVVRPSIFMCVERLLITNTLVSCSESANLKYAVIFYRECAGFFFVFSCFSRSPCWINSVWSLTAARVHAPELVSFLIRNSVQQKRPRRISVFAAPVPL